MTTTTSARRAASVALAWLLLPGAAVAQTAERCESFPSLGITGLACQNCTVSRSGSRRWASFSTEPRIMGVAPDGPASGLLRADDVIVAVGGHLITTRDGGLAFTDFDVGDEVHLRIRRDGRERDVRVVAEAACAPRAPAPPAAPEPAPSPPAPPAPAASPSPAAPSPPRAPEPTAPPAAPEPPVEVAGRMWQYSRGLPRLGMSLACDGCTLRMDDEVGSIWSFREWPEVRSVDRGSAAEAAGFRAGDRLVRLDGIDLRTPEGGRRMGRVRAGESLRWQVLRDGVLRDLAFTLPRAPAPPTPAAAPAPPAAPIAPVRAVARIGDVDVEVRGEPVVVLEDDDVVIIRAEGVEVRLQRRPTPSPSPPAPGGRGGAGA